MPRQCAEQLCRSHVYCRPAPVHSDDGGRHPSTELIFVFLYKRSTVNPYRLSTRANRGASESLYQFSVHSTTHMMMHNDDRDGTCKYKYYDYDLSRDLAVGSSNLLINYIFEDNEISLIPN